MKASKKKVKKSDSNANSVDDFALDTAKSFGYAIKSIGQEMLHQIAPNAVSKPGPEPTRTLRAKEAQDIIEIESDKEESDNKKDKEGGRRSDKTDVKKYVSTPFFPRSKVRQTRDLEDDFSNQDRDRISLEEDPLDIDREFSFSNSKSKSHLEKNKDAQKKKKKNLIIRILIELYKTIKRFIYLVFYPLKITLKIVKKIISLIFRFIKHFSSKKTEQKEDNFYNLPEETKENEYLNPEDENKDQQTTELEINEEPSIQDKKKAININLIKSYLKERDNYPSEIKETQEKPENQEPKGTIYDSTIKSNEDLE